MTKHPTGSQVNTVNDWDAEILVIRHVQQLRRKSQLPFLKQKSFVGPQIDPAVGRQSERIALATQEYIASLRAKETRNGKATTVTPLPAHVKGAGKSVAAVSAQGMTLVKVAGEAQTGWAFLELRSRKRVRDPARESIGAPSLESKFETARMPA